MCEENTCHEFRLKNTDETRNYFIEETKQNEYISKKHKKICKISSSLAYLLILASTVTGSDFTSLAGIWYCKFCSRNKNLCNSCSN